MKLSLIINILCTIISTLFVSNLDAEDKLTNIKIYGEVVNGTGSYSVANRGLLNALYVAGGFNRDAYITHIRVLGENMVFEFNVKEIIDRNQDDIWVPLGWEISVSGAFWSYRGSRHNAKLIQYIEERVKNENSKFDTSLMAHCEKDNHQSADEEKP